MPARRSTAANLTIRQLVATENSKRTKALHRQLQKGTATTSSAAVNSLCTAASGSWSHTSNSLRSIALLPFIPLPGLYPLLSSGGREEPGLPATSTEEEVALRKVPTEAARNPLLFAPSLPTPAKVGACAAGEGPSSQGP